MDEIETSYKASLQLHVHKKLKSSNWSFIDMFEISFIDRR